jgi:hypothetical protein
MALTFSSITRRALGAAIATTLVAGGLASAASPAGPGFFDNFNFRDDPGTAVLAVYPYSDGASPLRSLKVKGPRVAWPDSHPLPKGTVKWRIVLRTSDSKSGPWSIAKTTKYTFLLADQVGAKETFKNRSILAEGLDGRFVRVTSRLVWVNEDGGTMFSASRRYEKYGLVESSGIPPRFGDQTATRQGAAPTSWTN